MECSRRESKRTAATSISLSRFVGSISSATPSGVAWKRSRVGPDLNRLTLDRLRGGQQLFANPGLDVLRDVRMLLQERARVFLALPDALAVVAVPGAGFFHHSLRHADVDDLAHPRNALAVHD